MKIANTEIVIEKGAIKWTAGLAIDADGAPDAYGPPGTKPRDALANAGHPGNWWGVVTDNGQKDGNPVVQGSRDPCPGYYISPTALADKMKPARDPYRYVDSSKFPYLAVPPELLKAGVRLGDVAMVVYKQFSSPAIIADVGPRGKIGEGSIALARALGIDPSPRHGGTGAGVTCLVFCGSTRGWPRIFDSVSRQVEELLSQL